MFWNLGDTRENFEEGYSNWAFQEFEQGLEYAICYYVYKAGIKTKPIALYQSHYVVFERKHTEAR